VKRNTVKCLQSWADELLSRAERVRNLIGDAHWLTDGHHKEELVRDFLCRHLPNSLRVSRGFICPAEEDSPVSPEIDILISDAEAELPWFVEGGLSIVPPSAARAQLHVKTELGSGELKDVFGSSFRVAQSCDSQSASWRLWSGAIFFARTGYKTSDACSTAITSALNNYLGDPHDVRLIGHLPDCIAIVDGPVAILTRKTDSTEGVSIVSVKIFECEKLAAAILLSHLYGSIVSRGRDLTRRGEWVQVLQKQEYRVLSEKVIGRPEA
jgi:hypothetical protein